MGAGGQACWVHCRRAGVLDALQAGRRVGCTARNPLGAWLLGVLQGILDAAVQTPDLMRPAPCGCSSVSAHTLAACPPCSGRRCAVPGRALHVDQRHGPAGAHPGSVSGAAAAGGRCAPCSQPAAAGTAACDAAIVMLPWWCQLDAAVRPGRACGCIKYPAGVHCVAVAVEFNASHRSAVHPLCPAGCCSTT